MNEKELRAAVERVILSELAKIGEPYVPVMSSNRHCHLCQADVERLFGAGYRLTKLRDLVLPGQFACNERVTIETEKGKLTLRVVGPARDRTQVELSLTDAIKLGLRPPIVLTAVYAFLTIRFEDTSILDFIRYACAFFISKQQFYEWRYTPSE